jgi:multiple sugar transport system ATP-binding protein
VATVSLNQVSKTYPGDVIAVHPMDLDVSHGEFLVLVGPSGCGKSTTLRMVAGLEEITNGTIAIGDRVVNEVEPRDRDIAMVFQSYALYPHMSVRQNLGFGLKMRKIPSAEADRRVNAAAEVLGIGELLDRKPKALSGGQRQRVALGRAIVRDPAVFLFDEPLSNLDAKMRVQMRTEIARLHHKLGATMIYVTHDQTEAMTLGQRIVVMNDGVVQQVAAPLELYNRPVNRFVAGFIGSPAMNFLEGQVVRKNGLEFLVAGPEEILLPLPENLNLREDLLNRDLVLGVRPENFRVVESDAPGWDLTALVVEKLGNETFVHFQVAEHPLIIRTDGDQDLAVDQSVKLQLDPLHMHMFEPGIDGVRLDI